MRVVPVGPTHDEVFSLDEVAAENRYLLDAAHELTPEKIFDRRWATTLLEQAMARLRKGYEADNKGARFAKLEVFLTANAPEGSCAEIAASLNMSEGALKVAVHRLRQRYGELVRAEIAQTVATPEGIDEELRYLFSLLRE